MKNIKQELWSIVNIFKIFGLIIDNFNFRKVFIKYWPIIFYSIHALAHVALMSHFILCLILYEEQILSKVYIGIGSRFLINITGLVGVAYIFLQWKIENSFWKSVDQVDDFFLRFIDIKIDYQSETRKFFVKILGNISSIAMIFYLMFYSKFNRIDEFQKLFGSPLHVYLFNQLNISKFMLYVVIINNRLKILAKNFHIIRKVNYKVLVVPRIYTILWIMNEKLRKIYNLPLFFIVVNVYNLLLMYGFVMSLSVADGTVNVFQVLTIINPQYTLWILCYNCEQIKRNVRIFGI